MKRMSVRLELTDEELAIIDHEVARLVAAIPPDARRFAGRTVTRHGIAKRLLSEGLASLHDSRGSAA